MIHLDPEETIAAGCMEAVKRGALFVSAVWIGSGIGVGVLGLSLGLSAAAGEEPTGGLLSEGFQALPLLLMGPVYLFSVWLFLNVPLMVAAIFAFTRLEGNLSRWWLILANVQLVMVLLGHFRNVPAPGWLTWLLGILASGCLWASGRLIAALLHQRWIRQLEALAAENAERRRELKDRFGTE